MVNELLLVVAVSIDAFVMAVSCGLNCVKIPIKSAVLFGVVSAIVMVLSVCFSDVVYQYVPNQLCDILSCVILCAMGIMNVVRYYLSKRDSSHKCDDTQKLTDVYICGSCADCDRSKVISLGEAVMVSLLMSIDTLATGIVCGNDLSILFLGALTLIIQTLAVWLGSILGMKSTTFPDISLLGGLLLILLGFLQLHG